MATSKHPENQVDRETKVQELLSILGELYQRVGYQHAAPANARLTGPDYRFMGYRPYTTEALRAAVPQVPVPMARGFYPGQPEVMSTPRVF